MKKFLCALLSVILVIALVSCGGTKDNNNDATETLKLGLGTYTTVSATNATEDANGKNQIEKWFDEYSVVAEDAE